MGDFVDKEEVERIRKHYDAYSGRDRSEDTDNRARPVSGVEDASTFREVSTWYINRLLRYIEVTDLFPEIQVSLRPATELLQKCTEKWPPTVGAHAMMYSHGKLSLQLNRTGTAPEDTAGLGAPFDMMIFEDSDLERPVADLIAEIEAVLTTKKG